MQIRPTPVVDDFIVSVLPVYAPRLFVSFITPRHPVFIGTGDVVDTKPTTSSRGGIQPYHAIQAGTRLPAVADCAVGILISFSKRGLLDRQRMWIADGNQVWNQKMNAYWSAISVYFPLPRSSPERSGDVKLWLHRGLLTETRS